MLEYEAGSVILNKNQINQHFYLLYDGVASVCYDNNEIISLGSRSVFGEKSLLTDGNTQIQINSKTSTKILRVSGHYFFKLISNHEIRKNLFRILFDRVNDTNLQIIESLKKSKQELAAMVEQRTQELAKKNRELIDSLHYAKGLLQNILPDLSEITKHLNAFVFYQPKDIVAGDFYWYHKSGPDIYLLAGDCTGHGVPGAITSVICAQKLNEAIDKGYKNLKDILRFVDQSVKKVFRLENQDGMECALIKINKQQNCIEFCGVGRPLVQIRNQTLIEYNAVNSSIGHSIMLEEDLILHTINIEPNDCFYMFSDGYQDQFGGEKNKKYSSKRLKEFLKLISEYPINKQQSMISAEINAWMKTKENQIDDILMIGLKF